MKENENIVQKLAILLTVYGFVVADSYHVGYEFGMRDDHAKYTPPTIEVEVVKIPSTWVKCPIDQNGENISGKELIVEGRISNGDLYCSKK